MGTNGRVTYVMRWVAIFTLFTSMALAVSSPAPAGAAPPQRPGNAPPDVPGSSTPAADANRPGNHAAQQEWYYSQRLTPNGTISGTARAAALRQARALPKARTLPAAIGGKGTPSAARDGLAPPSAIWQQLGPAPEDSDTFNPNHDYRWGRSSGRATAIVVGPHTGVIYLGTADGGVWKSVNDGASWTPLTDNQTSLAIGSLALDPADVTDNTLYAGTGETNYDRTNGFNGDAYFGVGVLKTTNGGASWTLQGTGFPNFAVYGATSIGIGVMAANGATIWAGTTKGLYQSTNGGANWTQITVASGFPNARVTDLVVDGANVYVVLSEASVGFSYAGIYKSTTGGTAGSFNPIVTGLPAATTWGRAQVAIARSAPQTLYLAIADSAKNLLNGVLYKTTNGGTNWNATATAPNYFDTGIGGQGDYDNMLAVDPVDANLVYAGGVNMVASIDGGASWALLSNVYCGGAPLPCQLTIHPDIHAAAFGPSGSPRPLYIANDGGIWKTTNGNAGAGTIWSDLNGNLATTQFYAGDVASNYTTTPVVIAGAQDNGTSRTASTSLGTWNGINGGDGGFVAIDKTNVNRVFTSYPHGEIKRTTNASAGTGILWFNVTPIGTCTFSALFTFPFVIDRNAPNHLVMGGASFCETEDGGDTWVRSNQALAFSSTKGIQSVAIAPSNSAVLYAGTDTGFVYKTSKGNTAAAATWADCNSAGTPITPNTSIAVDPTNANTIYATFGGFGVPHVLKTIDCITWTNITGNLPDAPVTSIVEYPSTPNPTLIVGTDVGVFLSTNNGTSWSALQTGLPDIGVQQLFTDVALTTLFVATHGRGVWKIPIPADTNPAPTITALNPTSGPTTGGSTVTITGTGFLATPTVYFDGIPATNVALLNSTRITAVTPAHQAGQVSVTVVNPDNRGATLTLSYTYAVLNPLPNPQPGSGSGSPNPLPNPRQPTGLPLNNPSPLPPRRP